jgi:hypothetical protein
VSRRVEHAIVLDGREAAMLWMAADLNDLRIRSRSNPALYGLLHDIYSAGLAWHVSVNGSKQQISAEIEEPGSKQFVTVKQIAKRIGMNPRTVRNDIAKGLLKATKTDKEWITTPEAAEAYIAGRETR